jgi:hypothetical protein
MVFTIDQTAYMIFDNAGCIPLCNEFYNYQAGGEWKRIDNIPNIPGIDPSSTSFFVIDQKAYVGGGKEANGFNLIPSGNFYIFDAAYKISNKKLDTLIIKFHHT